MYLSSPSLDCDLLEGLFILFVPLNKVLNKNSKRKKLGKHLSNERGSSCN